MTKTKSAKFVSDEQKGSHHHKLVFVYNCSFVQEHILAFKEAKIYISTNNALPHTGIMYILWLVFFKDKLHVHLNVDIRCIQLHINLHVIECVQRVFDDSCIKSPKGRMESGCFDLKSGHFCQKIVGESNSKTDFALMFAKCFPLLFFARCCFLPNNGRS